MLKIAEIKAGNPVEAGESPGNQTDDQAAKNWYSNLLNGELFGKRLWGASKNDPDAKVSKKFDWKIYSLETLLQHNEQIQISSEGPTPIFLVYCEAAGYFKATPLTKHSSIATLAETELRNILQDSKLSLSERIRVAKHLDVTREKIDEIHDKVQEPAQTIERFPNNSEIPVTVEFIKARAAVDERRRLFDECKRGFHNVYSEAPYWNVQEIKLQYNQRYARYEILAHSKMLMPTTYEGEDVYKVFPYIYNSAEVVDFLTSKIDEYSARVLAERASKAAAQ